MCVFLVLPAWRCLHVLFLSSLAYTPVENDVHTRVFLHIPATMKLAETASPLLSSASERPCMFLAAFSPGSGDHRSSYLRKRMRIVLGQYAIRFPTCYTHLIRHPDTRQQPEGARSLTPIACLRQRVLLSLSSIT